MEGDLLDVSGILQIYKQVHSIEVTVNKTNIDSKDFSLLKLTMQFCTNNDFPIYSHIILLQQWIIALSSVIVSSWLKLIFRKITLNQLSKL